MSDKYIICVKSKAERMLYIQYYRGSFSLIPYLEDADRFDIDIAQHVMDIYRESFEQDRGELVYMSRIT